MSEFTSFLPPPGAAVANYDRSLPSSEQAREVPHVFCDAMSVREEVFVEEQGVPLSNEFDTDDPRSYHWVAYASVGTTDNAPSTEAENSERLRGSDSSQHGTVIENAKEQARRKGSTAERVAIGCIRLVPPPHPPHPEPGAHMKIDNADGVPPDAEEGKHSTSFHDGKEPYIKLGRLAALKPYRGRP